MVLFLALAYIFAVILDLAAAAWGGPFLVVWGVARMWSVAGAASLALLFRGEPVRASLRRWLSVSGRAVKLYLVTPLVVYAALGVYVALAYPVGVFDMGVAVGVIEKSLEQVMPPGEATRLAPLVAYAQIALAYVAAVTVNALAALGEELGWRGYLYEKLGAAPTLRNIVLIGVAWGLWHVSATLLLGYSYPAERVTGSVLYVAMCVAFTYPHLVAVSTARSVLPAASLHGAINALWPLTAVASPLPESSRELYAGMGVLGFAAWAVISLAVYVVTKRR